MGSTHRLCLFCGQPPKNQNLEHPLPMWLLEYTGDPSRVVQHSMDWKTGKPISFSFSSLRFPACEACNSAYGELEGEVKPVVLKTVAREALAPSEIVTLLDWLDKVRIGLWLG